LPPDNIFLRVSNMVVSNRPVPELLHGALSVLNVFAGEPATG